MPFLSTLIQDEEKVAAYSFIQSISTSLGMSIYEKSAKIIASPHFERAETGYYVDGMISKEELGTISRIVADLKSGRRKASRISEEREVLSAGGQGSREKSKCDLYLKDGDNEYFVEIKTVKPNIDVFVESKQKLLRWVALRKRPVFSALALPYNPYYPQPYGRFTLQGVLDEKREFFVAERFWDELLRGGEGTLRDLLSVFEEVGARLAPAVNEKIREVANLRQRPQFRS